MRDDLAERIAVALETIALEMAERNARPHPDDEDAVQGTWVPEARRAVQAAPQGPFPPIGGGQPPAPWVCPIHHTFKVVPAGVSKKTGKGYDAFTVCGTGGCDEKPPRGYQPAPARAVPPSEGIQGSILP